MKTVHAVVMSYDEKYMFLPVEETSQQLMKAEVAIISESTCNSVNVYNGHISVRMMCAGDLRGGTDSCQVSINGPV